MSMSDNITKLTTSIQLIIYVTMAVAAFLMTYPFYQAIIQMDMSTIANITISLCFFIMVYFVLVQGTLWVYRGMGSRLISR